MYSRFRKFKVTRKVNIVEVRLLLAVFIDTALSLGPNKMEFLGYQIGGDVITLSSDNLEKVGKLHVRPPRNT